MGKLAWIATLALVAGCAGDGGEPSPHDRVSCGVGAETCSRACVDDPTENGPSCTAFCEGPAPCPTDPVECPRTFKDSDGRRGCCLISPGSPSAHLYLECF